MPVLRMTGLLLACLIAGCVPKTRIPSVYTGPTEPIQAVVASINENNSKLTTLWSRGYFEANVVDQGQSHFVNGDVVILYRRPSELRIVGKKDIAGTIFDIGSDAARYWLIVRGEVDTMWWGTHDRAAAMDTSQIPIPPQLMLEVLGVSSIEANLLQPPVPVMRFNDDSDVYMLTWNLPLSNRWVTQKEVWYSRATKLPVKVLLFDDNGRVVLRADLSNHAPVDGADGAKVALNYNLYFRESRTSVKFQLEHPAQKSGGAPNDRSFAFPTEDGAGVKRVVRLNDLPSRSQSSPESSPPAAPR